MRNRVFGHMQAAKAQISKRICVRLQTHWILQDVRKESKGPNDTLRMRWIIRVFAFCAFESNFLLDAAQIRFPPARRRSYDIVYQCRSGLSGSMLGAHTLFNGSCICKRPASTLIRLGGYTSCSVSTFVMSAIKLIYFNLQGL